MVIEKKRVIISFKARASLKSYFEYLKNEVSNETAHYVKNGILEKCSQLKDFSGYSRDRFLQDEPVLYRSVTKWDYTIIYSVTEKEVVVLNIIHTHRHPDKRKEI